MITFKQFLEEAFNTFYPFVRTTSGKDNKYMFKEYDVLIKRISMSGGHTVFDISFYEESNNNTMPTGNKTPAEALKVYSTVIKIVDDFLSKTDMKKGDIIQFVAVSDRTRKLYERYTKYLAHKYDMKPANETSIGFFFLVKQ